MVPFERVMVVSCRLSIVTNVLSVTIRPHRMSQMLESTGVVTVGQNLEKKRLTHVSQI